VAELEAARSTLQEVWEAATSAVQERLTAVEETAGGVQRTLGAFVEECNVRPVD